MVKEKVTLNNETGLHARPASELAKIAMKYNCEINSKWQKNQCKISPFNNVSWNKRKYRNRNNL